MLFVSSDHKTAVLILGKGDLPKASFLAPQKVGTALYFVFHSDITFITFMTFITFITFMSFICFISKRGSKESAQNTFLTMP